MTLAAILLVIFWTTPAPTAGIGQASASAPQTSATQDQTTTPSQSPTAQTPSSSGSKSAKPRTTQSGVKKPVHKKKAPPPGCEAPAANSAPSSTPVADASNASAQKPAVAKPPANCPPEKIVVKHGGTTEPSIQLTGGPGGNQSSQNRDETTQLLGSTEANLKKLAGQQFSVIQKDSVTQIRGFMEQSRSALAAGDNERALALARKAKMLSDDLVPQQK